MGGSGHLPLRRRGRLGALTDVPRVQDGKKGTGRGFGEARFAGSRPKRGPRVRSGIGRVRVLSSDTVPVSDPGPWSWARSPALTWCHYSAGSWLLRHWTGPIPPVRDHPSDQGRRSQSPPVPPTWRPDPSLIPTSQKAKTSDSGPGSVPSTRTHVERDGEGVPRPPGDGTGAVERGRRPVSRQTVGVSATRRLQFCPGLPFDLVVHWPTGPVSVFPDLLLRRGPEDPLLP